MALKSKAVRKLNPRQRRFAQEYLKDQNATQAYLRVYGGKNTTAGVNSHLLLKNTNIQILIERGMARLAERAMITPEKNLKRIAEIAFESKRGRKERDVLKACELIGKTFGQFKDVVENKVEGSLVTGTQEEIDAAIDRARKKI